MDEVSTFCAFLGERCIAAGSLQAVLLATKLQLDADPCDTRALLIFDDSTGRQVEFDFRGSPDEVLARELPQPAAPPGPGRPKLGVVSREISLLPRHWEFLEAEPNGISAALRKLVEEALKRDPGAQLARRARDATGRFMTVMAGNLAGFEEASRALYARDHASFENLIAEWPRDIREHVKQMAAAISDWKA